MISFHFFDYGLNTNDRMLLNVLGSVRLKLIFYKYHTLVKKTFCKIHQKERLQTKIKQTDDQIQGRLCITKEAWGPQNDVYERYPLKPSDIVSEASAELYNRQKQLDPHYTDRL